jgi:hypothetical protein
VTVVEDDNTIPTDALTLAHVPPRDAPLEVLEQFCLTIDGYQGGRSSIEDLLAVAERVEQRGIEQATIEELRTTAFIRQREYRWSTDQGQENPHVAWKIRTTVAEIRSRLVT